MTIGSDMCSPKIFGFLLFFVLLAVSNLAAAELLRITVLGDSLTSGYGLPAKEAFPVKLEAALHQRGYDVKVQNAGVAGDTSAGGLARLGWTLDAEPALMIIELGANDALRGLPPALTRKNLDQILRRTKAAGVAALFTGMRAPRNLGSAYYTEFDRLFPELAAAHGIPFYPFFLEGVATHPELNQADGLHPNPAGVKIIVQGILPLVQKYLNAH